MENFLFIIIGAILIFFGYNYFQGVQNAKTQKKITDRKGEIAKMGTATLVNIANSIIDRRSNSNKR